MKYKIYALLLILITMVGFFSFKNNSQEIKITAENNDTSHAEEKIKSTAQIDEEQKNERQATETQSKNNFVTSSVEPELINSDAPHPKAEAQLTSTSEPEPNNENSNMIATGEFADEINAPEAQNCEEHCGENTVEIANNANAKIPSKLEFADQINSDAIFAEAQRKDANLQPEVKLGAPSEGTPPTTEIGAYTPPQ